MKNPFNFRWPWRALNIRNKMLSFYVAMILMILVINLSVSLTAFRYIKVFDEKLSVYYDIQEYRLAWVSSHESFFRYLRDRAQGQQELYFSSIPTLWQFFHQMKLKANTGLQAEFQLTAIERGMTEFFRRAGYAIRMLDSGDSNYYRAYVDARRVYDYVSGYTEILLNINLNAGSQTYAVLAARANNVRILSFISTAVVGGAFFLFAVLFSNSISRPIHRLAELSSRIAGGDLEVEILPVERADEVGTLFSSFNAMSRSIRQMVEGLKEKADLERRLHEEEISMERMQRSLQEARFMGLQSQINPHFLFNALNTISRTAMFEGAEGTSGLIKSLATLFRYHLRDPRKRISLAEELTILREYLSIQQYRYGDRLRYSIESSVSTEEIYVPAFTLQPLVENAVKHGIEPREEGGEIFVEVQRRRKRIEIQVRDTGCGMDSEETEGMIHASRERDGAGIGISNVRERLALFYGGREDFLVTSEKGVGTTVTISIPADKKGGEGCIPF
ncbi:histidine kinase [Marispirochaeta aestuarii]|uniref:sensor histidine kinase n=1 Tax=Marispirochaeta aestuarii TaxID=1963862 RepID=UPI0029C8F721|nr:histidine kinase [Marispirochaeta aestuarii]